MSTLLQEHGQEEWLGNRMYGLLLLMDWFCRPKDFKERGEHKGCLDVSCSGAMAEQYASPIKRSRHPMTIREPLAVLCAIGVLEKTRKSVFAHVKSSARYQITDRHRQRIRHLTAILSPKMYDKWATAYERREQRLNRQYAFRAPVLAALRQVSFAAVARPLIAHLRKEGKGGSLDYPVNAIDTREHALHVNEVGTITTSISSLPREFKSHLLLDDDVAVFCDVACMHHSLLPRLLTERIEYHGEKGRAAKTRRLEEERARLIERLSSGDYYSSWCEDEKSADERREKKKLLNTLLNMKNVACQKIPLYQRMRREFPLTIGVIEDIKCEDHRVISKQLQRYTSDAITGALLQCQEEGIAAIPATDAILCRLKHRERVREIIGLWVYKVSGGVSCMVDGFRFRPSEASSSF